MKQFLIAISLLISVQAFADSQEQRVECSTKDVKFSFIITHSALEGPQDPVLQISAQSKPASLFVSHSSVSSDTLFDPKTQKFLVAGNLVKKTLFTAETNDGDFEMTAVRTFADNSVVGAIKLNQPSKGITAFEAKGISCSLTDL